jgi:hypothetical protein
VTAPVRGKERWPDPAVPFDPVVNDDESRDRWQHAITAALTAGTLKLIPRDAPDVYDLVGLCPRCEHEMSTDIHERLLGLLPIKGTFVQNVACTCVEDHAHRPSGLLGCGWAPDLEIVFKSKGDRL